MNLQHILITKSKVFVRYAHTWLLHTVMILMTDMFISKRAKTRSIPNNSHVTYWAITIPRVLNAFIPFCIIQILLILSGIEINPGPSNDRIHGSISIVHNNVCSLLSKIDVIYSLRSAT